MKNHRGTERMTKLLTVRMTEAEMQQLKKIAEAEGLTVTMYVRNRIFENK